MENILTNAAFLSQNVWEDAVRRCVSKRVHEGALLGICSPEWRVRMYDDIISGSHEISPARTLYLNKRTGEFCQKYDVKDDDRREVMMNDIMDRDAVTGDHEGDPMYMYAGENGRGERTYMHIHGDRILLMVAYIVLCGATGDMVHPRCKSYQSGMSCGKAVAEAVRLMKPYIMRMAKGEPIGIKIDLSKYFDRVPRRYIWQAFDRVEGVYGRDAMITMLRKYYALDRYWDSGDRRWVEGEEAYKSLKQGCPVAAWLANVVLYHIDERISGMDVFYVRYSDDILIVGSQWREAFRVLEEELGKMEMTLNRKKLETLYADRRFVFLGFSILGEDISLSPKWVRHFVREIALRTWDMRWRKNNKHINPPRMKDPNDPKEIEARKAWRMRQTDKAIEKVKDFLYRGDGEHSWASQVLPYITNRHDILLMSEYVLDCIRAVMTGQHDLGVLRYDSKYRQGALVRDKGKSVYWNRRLTGEWFDSLVSISSAKRAMTDMCRPLYDALTRESVYGSPVIPEAGGVATVEALERAYEEFRRSVPDGSRWGSAFTADEVEDLSREEMLTRLGRPTAYHRLLQTMADAWDSIPFGDGWYWQSQAEPGLVVLKRWRRED